MGARQGGQELRAQGGELMMSHPRVFEHAFQVSREDIDRLGHVNALPPLKVVQLLGNACLSPTTLAPKDPFRSRGPRWILLFSLFSEEPHWLIPNDLVGALGAGPRPEGVGRPAAWLATVSRRCHSVDVFQQGRFLFPYQPLTSPLPKSQLHRITPARKFRILAHTNPTRQRGL